MHIELKQKPETVRPRVKTTEEILTELVDNLGTYEEMGDVEGVNADGTPNGVMTNQKVAHLFLKHFQINYTRTGQLKGVIFETKGNPPQNKIDAIKLELNKLKAEQNLIEKVL